MIFISRINVNNITLTGDCEIRLHVSRLVGCCVLLTESFCRLLFTVIITIIIHKDSPPLDQLRVFSPFAFLFSFPASAAAADITREWRYLWRLPYHTAAVCMTLTVYLTKLGPTVQVFTPVGQWRIQLWADRAPPPHWPKTRAGHGGAKQSASNTGANFHLYP